MAPPIIHGWYHVEQCGIAPSLLLVLQAELSHFHDNSDTTVLCRKRDLKVREVCGTVVYLLLPICIVLIQEVDNCRMTIFGASWMCRQCGNDFCPQCVNDLEVTPY
jgi:hypothetical protein